MNNSFLENITVSASVSIIEEYAFYWCENLKNVFFEEGCLLEKIGMLAFESCKKLESINLDKCNKLTKIECEAFAYCGSLGDVDLPDSLTLIDERAFFACESITEVVIPNQVTEIGQKAYSCCYSLKMFVVPKSVAKIGDSMFKDLYAFPDIFYEGDSESWSNILIGEENDVLLSCDLYFYSEEEPSAEGSFWHYVDGVPTAW